MNYVYHGSNTSGLKFIEPRKSTHQKEWVYAAKNKCVAALFLNKGSGDLTTKIKGSGTKKDPIIFVERLPGIFDKILNVSGFIYTLKGSSFEEGKTSWPAEVVSDKKEKVISEEKIDNLYDKLKEFEKEGLIKIYNYPNRPKDIPIDNTDLINKYINYFNMGHTHAIDNLLNLYPEFKERVEKKINKKSS